MHVCDMIISPENQQTYSPAAHSGTVNRRLVSRDLVGAQHLEINYGEVEPGGEAEPHLHSKSEQAIYILEGRAVVEMWGERAEMGAGQIVFFPAGVRHKISVAGDTPMRCIVIYSPPLADATSAFETD